MWRDSKELRRTGENSGGVMGGVGGEVANQGVG